MKTSASGNHSSDLANFETTADFSLALPQNYHKTPKATPRFLEV